MTRYPFTIVSLFLFVYVVVSTPVASRNTSTLEARMTHEGRGTWFYPGMGNCGWENNSHDLIVAISKARYDSENAVNCGQWMQITNAANGRAVMAKTVDSCPGCSFNDLDMSPATFEKLDNPDVGTLRVSWHFMAKGWHP